MTQVNEQFDPFNPMEPGHGPSLCPQDEQALDALIQAGLDPSKLAGQHHERARRMMSLFARLDAYPLPDADDEHLVTVTLDRIRSTQHLPHMIPEDGVGQAKRWRLPIVDWRNALAAAAAILILASIFIPMMANSRSMAMRTACMNNLGQASIGMGLYSSSNNGSLPVRYTTAPDGDWLTNRTNTANLFYLAKSGYAAFADLNCPCNPDAPGEEILKTLDNWPSLKATSFSYQHMIGSPAPRWQYGQPMVIMADRSPLIDAAHEGHAERADAPSSAHGRNGENILVSDGSNQWIDSAFYKDDNIWLPRSSIMVPMYMLRGDEMPVDEFDTMLTN